MSEESHGKEVFWPEANDKAEMKIPFNEFLVVNQKIFAPLPVFPLSY